MGDASTFKGENKELLKVDLKNQIHRIILSSKHKFMIKSVLKYLGLWSQIQTKFYISGIRMQPSPIQF